MVQLIFSLLIHLLVEVVGVCGGPRQEDNNDDNNNKVTAQEARIKRWCSSSPAIILRWVNKHHIARFPLTCTSRPLDLGSGDMTVVEVVVGRQFKLIDSPLSI